METNFRFDRAEIDVIARDRHLLVFIEVKTRKAKSLCDPEDSITMKKRAQIRKAAEGYLYKRQLGDVECRFDVIAIKDTNGKKEIKHYEDIF